MSKLLFGGEISMNKFWHKVKLFCNKKVIVWIGTLASLAIIVPVCVGGALKIRDMDFGYELNKTQIATNTQWIERHKNIDEDRNLEISKINTRLDVNDKRLDNYKLDHDLLVRIDQHVLDLQKAVDELKGEKVASK